MANTLMFEVGVKYADDQLSNIKRDLEALVEKGKSPISIKVKIEDETKSLQNFLNLLSQIGDGKQLRDLKEQVDTLLASFSKMGITASNIDVSALKKQLDSIDKTYDAIKKKETELKGKGETGLNISNATAGLRAKLDGQLQALQSKFNMTEEAARQVVNSSKEIDGSTKNVVTSLNSEGAAAKDAVQKLNALVTEKQQVVDAERKLAESSKTGGQTLREEADNADKTAQSIKGVGKAQKDAADASKKAEKEQAGTVDNLAIKYQTLIARIENWQSSLSKLLAGGDSKYFGAQLNNAIEAYGRALRSAQLGSIFDESGEHLKTLRSELQLLGAEYANVNREAKAFNKTSEQAEKAQQKAAEKAAAIQQKFEAELQKRYSDLGIRQNDPGLQNIQTAMDSLMQKLGGVREYITQLQQAAANGSKEGIQYLQESMKLAETEANSLMRQYIALAETMDRLGAGGKERSLLSTEQSNKELQMLNEAFRTGTSEMQKLFKAKDEARKKQDADDKKAEQTMKTRMRSVDALDNKLSRLEARKIVDFANLDTSKLDAAIGKIRTIREELERFAKTGTSSYGSTQNEIMRAMGLDVANREASLAISKLNSEKRESTALTAQMASEEQKLAQAISHSSNEMRNQSQILSDLKMMAMQYVSVWGASNFLHNIIETGGLLEQQRLSIGAILQNTGQATELFGKIKSLALKSPFGVVELDKMSKQLTAYGFEYNELFDWTKRLADISAATGTSVDRLALALGHVRSEGALSGYTLRQFAMANVPVLRMLSENLGISTKEVRERVRKKDISYEDVQDILRQLTDKGGMFFEAQETMSQALNAKFKNLRDAFDIMYNEIAESGVGDLLKEWAGILTTGAKHWKELADVVLWTGGAFGVAKAAIFLCNQTIGAGTAATLKSAAADKQKEVNMLRLAKEYRALSAAEWQLLATHSHWYATSGKLTQAQLTELLNEKKLGQEELYRAVALKKINKELALKAALEMKAGTAAERHAKAEILWGLRGVQTISRWRSGWITLGNGIRAAGAALWSFTKIAIPMAALSAIVELFARTSQMRAQAKEASDDLAQKATSDMKVLNETFKELQSNDYFKATDKSGKYINGRRVVEMGITFNEEKLRSADLTDEIENLKGKLQDLSPMYEGDLIDIDKMDNQVEQFKLIVRKLESIRHANDVTEAMSNVVTDANVDVAGKHSWTRLFGDTYTADVRDYEEAMNDMAKYVNDINEQTIDKVDKELGGKLSEIQKKYSLDSKNSALASLFADWSKGGVPANINQNGLAKKLFDNAAGGLFTRSLGDQFQQLEADTKEMAEKMSAIVVNQFKDDPDGAIYAITTYMKKLMSMAGITDPRVMNEATRMMLDEMRKYLPKNMQQGVADEMQRRILMEQFSSLIGNTITESTKPEDAEEALKKYADLTIKWGEQMGYDLKKIGMDNAEAYRDGLQAKLNQVKLKTDWQKRASQMFVVNTSIKNNFDKSLDEFAQAVQKDLKAKQDYLKRNKAHLKMTLNIDTDILMNADKLRALMDRLALEGQKKAAQGDWEGAQAIYSRIDKEIKPYYDALIAVEEDKKWLKKEGYPEKDLTKGGNGSQENKDAKELRERMRILKEAADAYKYWKKAVGEGGAEAHVNEEFGDVMAKLGYTFKDIQQFRKTIMDEVKKYEDIYNKSGKKRPQLLEAIKEGYKTDAGLNRNEFEETAEEFASKVQIELDSLTRAWEIFNNVREATGNVELAVQISGADYAGGKTRNLADALREKIQKDFDAAGGGIAFDMNLSYKDIEESINRSMPAASQEQIKGLVDEYKKWRDLQRDVLKNDIDVFAKLVGGSKDYESQIQKINDGLEKQVAALNEVAKNNPEKKKDVDKAIGAATAQAEYDKWKLSTQYINLMNNSLSLTRKEVDEGINVAMQRLNDLMQHNRISAQEYADEMAKIQNIQSEFTKNSFFGSTGAWASGMMGGLSGLRNFYQSQLNSPTIIKSDLENKWKQRGLDRKEWEQYEKASNNIESFNSKLEDLNRLESLTSSFDALAKAIDPVINLFNKLGMTGIGSILGIGQSALQSASSMGIGASILFKGSATAGMWGAGIGAGLSIVGGIADSLFGGFDEALQKEIEASKQRQKEMEYMSKNLETALERALGGVYGVSKTEQSQNLIDEFNKKADKYIEKYGKFNQALATIQDRGSITPWEARDLEYGYIQNDTIKEIQKAQETGKYYDMQRASLKIQQDELRNQISSEKDKKDTDWGAVSDMEQQIKELDDQWRNFAKDMMKALYDIDIKDWASEFGDALYEAWKQGENGAEAFKKKASEIIGNIAKNILVKRVIETALKPVEDAIIKMMDDTSGELSEKDFTDKIGGLLSDSIGKIVPTVNAALDAVDAGLQKQGLPSLKENTSSLSDNIKGITESTADLLASYLNAIRADVSVNRTELLNIRENYLKDIKTQITSSSASLRNIENHTAAIMRSNDVIADKITNLDNNINGLRNGIWGVHVS